MQIEKSHAAVSLQTPSRAKSMVKQIYLICDPQVPLQFRQEPKVALPIKHQLDRSSLERHCPGTFQLPFCDFLMNRANSFPVAIPQLRNLGSNVYMQWDNNTLGNYTNHFATMCQNVFDLLLPPALQAPIPIPYSPFCSRD